MNCIFARGRKRFFGKYFAKRKGRGAPLGNAERLMQIPGCKLLSYQTKAEKLRPLRNDEASHAFSQFGEADRSYSTRQKLTNVRSSKASSIHFRPTSGGAGRVAEIECFYHGSRLLTSWMTFRVRMYATSVSTSSQMAVCWLRIFSLSWLAFLTTSLQSSSRLYKAEKIHK